MCTLLIKWYTALFFYVLLFRVFNNFEIELVARRLSYIYNYTILKENHVFCFLHPYTVKLWNTFSCQSCFQAQEFASFLCTIVYVSLSSCNYLQELPLLAEEDVEVAMTCEKSKQNLSVILTFVPRLLFLPFLFEFDSHRRKKKFS